MGIYVVQTSDIYSYQLVTVYVTYSYIRSLCYTFLGNNNNYRDQPISYAYFYPLCYAAVPFSYAQYHARTTLIIYKNKSLTHHR